MKKLLQKKELLMFLLFAGLVLFLEVKEAKSYFNAVISIKGNVVDAETKDFLSSSLVVTDHNGKIAFRTKSFQSNGEFYITGLKPDAQYNVRIISEGYEDFSYNIQTPETEKYVEIKKEFELKKKVVEN